MSTVAGGNVSDMGPKINGISWSLTAIAGLFLGIRLYVRVTQSRLWWDDHLLSASWLLLLVQSSIMSYAVSIGFGQHTAAILEDNIITLVKLVSISGIFTLVAAGLSKTSFALTLLRLTEGWQKIGVWVIIISLNATLLVNAILPFLRCMPIEASWNPAVPGTCFDMQISIRFSIFAAAYSALSDWSLALISSAVIMGLNMRMKERIGVAVCMGLGFIAGATSIIRCLKIPLLNSDDFTFRAGELAIWTVAEIATTIMATSIPVMRVFLRKIVTGHPNHGRNGGGMNAYHRSAADGTFLRSLRVDTKDMQHTTVITSGIKGRNSSSMDTGSGRGSKERGYLRQSATTADIGRIIKVDTVAVHYDQRRSDETHDREGTLVNGESNAPSSVELDAMPDLITNSSKGSGN